MRNIKLVLEYEGTSFFGFQKQPHHPTIQEELEKALSRLLNRKTKIKAASGRTDAGVHAAHQVVSFLTPSPMPARQMLSGLNALLPPPIAVRSVEEAGKDFHARYRAKSKTYEYCVWNDPVRSPLKASKSFHIREKLNLEKMRSAAKLFLGRHDFKSFCSSQGPRAGEKNTIRTVRRFRIRKVGNLLVFAVEANGFLYRMVRNLVGALIDVGRGKISRVQLKRHLEAKDRRKLGAAAPSHGLTLVDVTY